MTANSKSAPNSVVSTSDALLRGCNLVTETFDRRCGNGSGVFSATGQLRGTASPVREGDTFSTLYGYSIAAGTAVTALQYAIYDQNYNLVANTADIKAALGVNVWVPGDLTTPWTSTYTGVVHLVQFCTFTTTSPSMATCPVTGSASFFSAPSNGVGRVSWSQNNATLPAAATPVASSLIFYLSAS